MALKALGFNCTLKSSPADSSTERLMRELLDALGEWEVTGDIVRAVDHNIKPGVSSDEGDGDAWPELRRRIIDADILIMGSPIWLGQPSSVAK
jgi:multimeric flavodoxin WrbA